MDGSVSPSCNATRLHNPASRPRVVVQTSFDVQRLANPHRHPRAVDDAIAGTAYRIFRAVGRGHPIPCGDRVERELTESTARVKGTNRVPYSERAPHAIRSSART